MQVPRPVAVSLNTLNILAPVLLLMAVITAAIARFGNNPPEVNRLLLIYSAILVVCSIVIRIIWGILIHLIKKRAGR